MPSQPVTTTPGTPASAKVGTFGSIGWRYGLVTAKPLMVPASTCSLTTGEHLDDELDVAARSDR